MTTVDSSSKRTKGSVLVTRGGKNDYSSKFKRMLATPPTRLAKPLNPGPSKMKKIWKGNKVEFVESGDRVLLVSLKSLKELRGALKEHEKPLGRAFRDLEKEHREEARV